jgi:hypothetical protein
MFVALAGTGAGTQSLPSSRDTLTSELAARVAAAVAPQARVTLEPGADTTVDAGIVEQLAARGVQVVGGAEGVPSLRVTCFDNLRERACAAEISGTARTTILVTRRHEPAAAPPVTRLGLELRSLVSAGIPILDLARDDDDLLALMRGAIVRYRLRDEGWTEVDARAISSADPWPRDMRGRMRIAGSRFEAFVPGLSCTGAVDPLTITCAEQGGSWPLDMDGARLEPGRNHFTVPGGLTFYGIARLAADADARWLAATLDHRLTLIDETRETVSTGVAGEDVAALRIGCAPAAHVLASASSRDGETLTLFRVARRQLTAAAGAIVLPGELTALWPTASGDSATVITRDRDAGRYVAHELTVSCPR